jgi:hypothetical protein
MINVTKEPTKNPQGWNLKTNHWETHGEDSRHG